MEKGKGRRIIRCAVWAVLVCLVLFLAVEAVLPGVHRHEDGPHSECELCAMLLQAGRGMQGIAPAASAAALFLLALFVAWLCAGSAVLAACTPVSLRVKLNR